MLATLTTIIIAESTTPAGFNLWLRIGAAVVIAAALIMSCWPDEPPKPPLWWEPPSVH